MKKITLSIFIFFTIVHLSRGQNLRYDGFAPDENKKKQLSEMLSEYDLIEMDLKQFNTNLSKDSNERNISIVLPSGKSFSFSLYKKDIRSGDYKSSITSVSGMAEETYDMNKTYTYRGSLTEGGFVRLTVKEDFIYGLIDDASGSYIIDQLKYVLDDSSIPGNQVIIYRIDSVYEDNGVCFTDDKNGKDTPHKDSKETSNPKSLLVPTTCEIIEVATDADYEYFLEHGGNARTRILAEFNNIQGVYETTFDLDVVVVFQNVWTFSNDPYTSTNFAQINNEIETAWQNSFSNRNFDVIQMFTGKNLGGLLGRANAIGNVCTDDYANNYTVDVNLNNSYTVAHELGHNLGGTHPPAGEPTSLCAGNDNQRTVMCQGSNIARIVFSAFSTNQITNYITNNSNCLTDFEGNYSISGPTNFCPSGFFSINNFPQDGTVTWSVTPANSLSFTQGDPTTTFTRIGSFSGLATITANVGASCSNIVTSKNVNIKGTINFNWSGTGPYGQVDVDITSGTAPYKIYRGTTLLYSGSNASTTVNFGCNGGVIKVEANTPCGVASKSDIIPQGCASFRGQSNMVVYPNPTSSDVNVVQTDDFKEVRTENSLGKMTLELYNFDGNMVKSQVYPSFNGEVKMDMSDLRKATYLLRILAKEVDEVHQVIVE